MANQKITASTQQHLDIDDIIEDLILLKTGWVALVITTTAVNFDLLSEAEQDATIYAYGALLNSLTFPVQILIRTKKADITSYFQHLAEAEQTQPNPDLKRQIQKYEDFIQATVQQKTVLEKEFYLVINFSQLELGIRGASFHKTKTQKSKAQLVIDAKNALFPKRDHLIKQLARLGLTARQMTTQELIELFYDIYNPAPTGTQRIILDTASYTTPMVRPALETPTPAPQQSPPNTKNTQAPPQSPQAQPLSQFDQSRVGLDQSFPQLRPVPPPGQSPSLQSQRLSESATGPAAPPGPQSTLSEQPTHTQALKDLQDTAAKASQLLNQKPDGIK